MLSGAALATGMAVGWAAGRFLHKPEYAAETRFPRLPASDKRPQIAEAAPAIEREVARKLLLYAVPPVWIAAGLADWLCHRATHIETTAGAKESLMHLLMQAEFAVPVLATLFCEVTPPVILSEIAAFLAHEATVNWDLSYTSPRREIPPIEQQVHAYLELLPLVAIVLIAVLHWPETKASFGFGARPIDLSLRLRKHPLPWSYRIGLLTAVALFNGLPYLEELWRSLRANRGRLVPDRLPGQGGIAAARNAAHSRPHRPASGV
jgi:hypothetical protein